MCLTDFGSLQSAGRAARGVSVRVGFHPGASCAACRSPPALWWSEAGGTMSRARHMSDLAFVLGLSLGTPIAAPAQNASAAWQATPASILKNTLRNVVAAQDQYRAKHNGFAKTAEALQVNPGGDVKIQI